MSGPDPCGADILVQVNEPWGISGPEFLAIYGGLLGLPIVLMLGWRLALRVRRATTVATLPSAYHYAYLLAGPDRVVDAATATLIDQERVRVDSRGRLTAIGRRPPSEPLAAEVWHTVRGLPSCRISSLRTDFRDNTLVTGVAADLVERGMVVPKTRVAAVWRAIVVLYILVLAVGVARWVNGVRLDRPVGYLALLVQLGALLTIIAVASRRRFSTTVTTHGARVRKAARAGQVDLLTGAAGAVALRGLPKYPDPAIGAAFASSSSGGGSTYAGGSGCGSGSSCGGGGGGGGGGGCGG